MKIGLGLIFIFLGFSLSAECVEKINFTKKFIEFASEGYLDKNKFQYLKELANSNKIQNRDRYAARQTIKNLSKFTERIRLQYTIEDINNKKTTKLDFVFTPTYSENEKISGKNIYEMISNISQKDNLNETKADDDRCGTASLLNAYLIMGGNFEKLTKEFGLKNIITYKNIHLLQEKLYNIANIDKKSGIYSGFKYKTFFNGYITDIRPSGEIVFASDKIGIEVMPLIGKTLDTIDEKKEAIEDFFQKKPNGVLQVGVYLELKNGKLLKPTSNKEQNHFITVFKLNNDYYLSDTSPVNNGDGKNIKKLTKQELKDLLYNTSGIINGLSLEAV